MKRTLLLLVLVFLLPASGLAQERIKFPVGVSSKVLGYGHLWAAWRLKYFEREGLDVDVVLMRGTAPAVQAMIAGSISAGLVANDGPIAAVEQGMDLAMVAELEIDMNGLKTVVDIYAEQTGNKGVLPNPEKYVDSSYLKQAWKELGWK